MLYIFRFEETHQVKNNFNYKLVELGLIIREHSRNHKTSSEMQSLQKIEKWCHVGAWKE